MPLVPFFLSRQRCFCLPSFFTLFFSQSHSLPRSINQHSDYSKNNNSSKTTTMATVTDYLQVLVPALAKLTVKTSLKKQGGGIIIPILWIGKIKPQAVSYCS